jgi:Allene oxide cyclase barrel like domain
MEADMFKRLGVTGAVIAIAALAAGSVGPAAGTGDDHGESRHTIRVVSHNTEENFVDVGKQGLSLGDEFVFTSRLTRHGKKVGHTGVVCTFTSVKREESQCLGSAKLRRGEITIQGLQADDPRVFSFAITGGTGAYEGAEGTLVVRELRHNRELLSFHLSD